MKQAVNPFLPSYEYIPDGEPHVFGERLYLYGSHDSFGAKTFCQNDYVCYSASIYDLTEWTYEGVIYRKNQDPMNMNGKMNLYAPDVARGKDGRYYLFYSFELTGIIAVAVCDEPAGKYNFYGHIKEKNGQILSDKTGTPFLFDPGVLVEEDGSVYLYTGFAPRYPVPSFLTRFQRHTFLGGYVTELEPDMLTVKKEPKLIFHRVGNTRGTGFYGHEFFEASSIRKIGTTYYFIYSSVNGHELCYATSKSPTEGFQFGGTLISNGDLYLNGEKHTKKALNYTGNNHGSIVEVNGAWYVFYHRHTNRHPYSRQAMAEPINILGDGRISQVEMTSSGLNNGPLIASGEYDARIACHLMSKKGTGFYGPVIGKIKYKKHPFLTQEGKDRESDGDQYIANMRNGSVAGFRYFEVKELKKISIKVRGNGKGRMLVKTALKNHIAAEIQIRPTLQYAWSSTEIVLSPGTYSFYFQYEGTGYVDFMAFSFLSQ